jgi:hypothetical protein
MSSHSMSDGDRDTVIQVMDLAAFLSHRGHRVIAQWWEERNRRWSCRWKFEGSDDLDLDVADYNSGEARVEPRQFLADSKRFKSEAFSNHPEPSLRDRPR